MSYNGISLVSILSPEIDATMTGPFQVAVTDPAAGNFCVTSVLIFLTDISGLVSIPNNISIGYTGPNYNEFVNNVSKDLETVGEFSSMTLQNIILSPPGNTTISGKIGIVANATTYKVRFVLIGYYV